MKLLVIGCGSIGQRHISNLIDLNGNIVTACDIDNKKLHYVTGKYNIRTYTDINKALKETFDAVLICTPPSTHIELAEKVVKHNIPVFIEKPISNDFGVRELKRITEKKNLIVMVGYNLRFNREINLIKETLDKKEIGKVLSVKAEFGYYLPDWHPNEDYTKSYSARSELGGGILLDASHEFDYLSWFFGDVKEVFCYAGTYSKLRVDVEDTADILLKFKSGLIGSVHLDFTQRTYTRTCKIIGEKGTINWDCIRNKVNIYVSKDNYTREFVGENDINESYVDEIKHFIHCVKTGEKPISNLGTAIKTLDIALFCKMSSKYNKVIEL